MEIFWIIVLGFIILTALLLVFLIKKQQRLSSGVIKKIKKEILGIQGLDPIHRLYESDKLLDYCLKQKKVSGKTMGERMKRYGNAFTNTQAVWKAHKLRNTLAHEIGANPSEKELLSAVNALIREVKAFIGN